jgi:hypothetical protein
MVENKLKGIEEVSLIADFEMEYGSEDNWSEETIKEFDDQWQMIQDKYKERI